MTDLTLALDMMGGDFGPPVTVPAALQALAYHPRLKLLLVGDRHSLTDQLRRHDCSHHSRISLIHAEQVIQMDERPLHALRYGKRSSMRMALDLVRDGKAAACVSSGNTGALMAMAKIVIRALPGIDRPALVSQLPTMTDRPVYMLDLGANVTCDSEILLQFAVMGSVLAEQVGGRSNPEIKLLNVGHEELKGNDLVQQTAQSLKDSQLNYGGFIEGSEIFSGQTDVIVCDGFVGNIALKTTEGIARLLSEQTKKALKQGIFNRLAALVLKRPLRDVYNKMNPDQYNGAILLGLRSIVVKSHGNADMTAFAHAIDEAIVAANQQVPDQIKDRIESVLLNKI